MVDNEGAAESRPEPGRSPTRWRGSLRSKQGREELWAVLYARWREPIGPFRREAWRSPVRGPWLTSVFGAVLLVGIPIEFITGLVSYAAYDPRLGRNDQTSHHGILGFYLFNWVTSPSWLYRFNQGVHVCLGLVLVPVVLAKLGSVIPKLFTWPPAASAAKAFERLTLLLLVGGIAFEMVTGIMNIGYDYASSSRSTPATSSGPGSSSPASPPTWP